MSRIHLEHKTIASVFPLKLPQIERLFNGFTVYKIDVCPRERISNPPTLRIFDAYQLPIDPLINKVEEEKKILIPCEQIAVDVLNNWQYGRIGTPPGVGPGVWICAEDTPTKQEIDAALERQTAFAEYLYHEAQALAAQEQFKQIEDLHRGMSRWLNKPDAWVQAATYVETNPCPFCEHPVKTTVYVCPKCNNFVRPLPPELQALRMAQSMAMGGVVGAVGANQMAMPPQQPASRPQPVKG